MKYAKKYMISLTVNLFLFLTVFFFSPSEVILGNLQELYFSYAQVWHILLLAGVGCATIKSVLESLLGRRIWQVVVLATFAMAFCFYVQVLFLNGNMDSMTGMEDDYSSQTRWVNIAVWVVMVATVVIGAIIFLQKKKGIVWLALVSTLALVMQLAGFASLLPQAFNVAPKTVDNYSYLTIEGDLELSKKNNTVVFVLDTVDSWLLDDVIRMYPETFDELTGFTYYPDMVTTYSRTYPSLTYMLTQYPCFFDKPADEWIDEAFASSTFISDMVKSNVNVGLYAVPNKIGDPVYPLIVNYGLSEKGIRINTTQMLKAAFDMAMYRHAPYALKSEFKYDVGIINANVVEIPTDEQAPTQYQPALYEQDFHLRLLENGVAVNDDPATFRFIYFWGAHGGCRLMPDGMYSETVTSRDDALRGCFTIISKYIQTLKSQGLYDDTTIIITTDHGSSGSNLESLDLPRMAGALLFVKPAGVSEGAYTTSYAPVCHEDLFATIYEGLGLDGSAYGKTIYEIPENAERERMYYYSSLFADLDGEVALREYTVDGDARQLESYEPTGRYWDINFSHNIVSEKRFEDYLEQ